MKPGQDVSRNTLGLGHDHCSLLGHAQFLGLCDSMISSTEYRSYHDESTRKRYGYQDHLQRSAPNQAARSGSQTRSQKKPLKLWKGLTRVTFQSRAFVSWFFLHPRLDTFDSSFLYKHEPLNWWSMDNVWGKITCVFTFVSKTIKK